MNQINIFQEMYQTFKFNKPTITLFEAFAGIGSQAVALRKLSKEFGFYLNVEGISEIDKYAIDSYKAIHGNVFNFGDIAIINALPNNIDIFTYSFPCQDISLAGERKGLAKGSGTRSGLLWEVERLLKISDKPKVLLMENVSALVSENHIEDFKKWLIELEKLGYTTYWERLNAKDYGVAQNRDRVFAVSILGEYNYDFPKPFPLKSKVRDILEESVDKRFYLSDKAVKGMLNTTYATGKFENRVLDHEGISSTLCARDYKDPKCIVVGALDMKGNDQIRRVYSKDGISPTLTASEGGHRQPKFLEGKKVRKLTPREYWRLMGFSDQDFEKAAKVCSNSQLYKQAGNSIVVDVLYYIFKNLF